jgi:hypothetical protein
MIRDDAVRQPLAASGFRNKRLSNGASSINVSPLLLSRTISVPIPVLPVALASRTSSS